MLELTGDRQNALGPLGLKFLTIDDRLNNTNPIT